MIKWIKNLFFKKDLRKTKMNRAEIKKAIKHYSKNQLITMISRLGHENIILKKKVGLI